MENDLAELQMLLMDQQRSLESMSEQLIVQAKNVTALEKRIRLLESKLTEGNPLAAGTSAGPDERPPHY